jgi:hypothetical protein
MSGKKEQQYSAANAELSDLELAMIAGAGKKGGGGGGESTPHRVTPVYVMPIFFAVGPRAKKKKEEKKQM